MTTPSDFARIRELEEPAIQARRQQASGQEAPTTTRPSIGFGLSGGGIRSATFSLGLFQSLARLAVLKQIDFLSTVSGGGYFGSFLGRLFTRTPDELRAAVCDTSAVAEAERLTSVPELVETVLKTPDSKPNRWLRENGRFLAPNGSGDLLLGLAIALRNWAAIHVVLASFLFWLMMSMQVFRFEVPTLLDELAAQLLNRDPTQASWLSSCTKWLESTIAIDLIWWSPWAWVPCALFLFGLFPLAWAYWLVQSEKEQRDNYGGLAHWFGLAAVAVLMAVELRCDWPLSLSANEQFVVQSLLPVVLVTLIVHHLTRRAHRQAHPLPLADLDNADARDANSEMVAAQSRNTLSVQLAAILWIIIGLATWTLIDSLGQTLYAAWKQRDLIIEIWIPVGFASLGASALFAQKLAVLFGSEQGRRRPGGGLRLLCTFMAVGLAVIAMSILSALSHGAVWGWKCPASNPGPTISANWRAVGEWMNVLPKKNDEPGTTTNVQQSRTPVRVPADVARDVSRRDLWVIWTGSFVLSLAFARLWPFLNRSTLQSLYNSRLRRAYLGASNPKRWSHGIRPVVHPMEGDGIPFDKYQPHAHGGPLHFLNVTINETIDGRSQVQQQDRHGVGMAVGPCGVSVGVRHHAIWCNRRMLLPPPYSPMRFQVFEDRNHPETSLTGYQPTPIEVESLELSEWAGVSGAAFSTGLGMRTSLSLSLLAGFFNVRLGHWWDSGVNPIERKPRVIPRGPSRFFGMINRIFPIPMYLLDEFTARFHGTARQRWYLTDGGHFENLAGYELIRRRIPLIVLCDGEEDSHYSFEGLSNLVRKSMTDFDAEIRFWNEKEIAKRLGPGGSSRFGTLEDLRRAFTGKGTEVAEEQGVARRTHSHRHAAIATVRYDASKSSASADASDLQAEDSLLIYIKATVTNDEPADIRQYADEHPAFPHEPTTDQFFDEAQWESYRKLGEHIGTLLFKPQPLPRQIQDKSKAVLAMADTLMRTPIAPKDRGHQFTTRHSPPSMRSRTESSNAFH